MRGKNFKKVHVHIPGVMEVHVINLTTNRLPENEQFFNLSFISQILRNRVKSKYNLNPKIHSHPSVYTSIDNEARKKITR
jgi:hypothetical protein